MKIPVLNLKEKFSPIYIGILLFFVCSDFYLYGVKPFSPVYYFYFLGLFVSLVLLIKRMKFTVNFSQMLVFIIMFYVILVYQFQDNNFVTTFAFISAISYYPIGIFLLKAISRAKVIKICNYMLLFNLILLSTESFWRLTHPIMARDTMVESNLSFSDYFYAYKLNSIMCGDSNFVAILIVILLFFTIFLYSSIEKRKLYIFYIIAFSLLTILTLSRSAIILSIVAVIIFSFAKFFKQHIKYFLINKMLTLKLALAILIIIPILGIVANLILKIFLSDSSFITKIEIFINTIDAMKQMHIGEILVGVSNKVEIAIKLIGRFPHNIVCMYFMWFGVIGMFLVYYLWFKIYEATPKSILIFLPIILMGYNLCYINCHLFYAVLAIMHYFKFNVFQIDNITNVNYNNQFNIVENNTNNGLKNLKHIS